MARRVKITFSDGQPDAEVEIRAGLLVQAERKYKGNMPPIEGTLFAAFKGIKPSMPFEQWLDTIDEFEEAAGEDAHPTNEEQPVEL